MTTVPILLSTIPGSKVDILKLDIEGEEFAVLGEDASSGYRKWVKSLSKSMELTSNRIFLRC
jgi:hypothetical protein